MVHKMCSIYREKKLDREGFNDHMTVGKGEGGLVGGGPTRLSHVGPIKPTRIEPVRPTLLRLVRFI